MILQLYITFIIFHDVLQLYEKYQNIKISKICSVSNFIHIITKVKWKSYSKIARIFQEHVMSSNIKIIIF